MYVESGTCIKSEAAADRVHRSTIPVGRWLKHSQKTSQKQVHFKKSMITDTKVYTMLNELNKSRLQKQAEMNITIM